MMKYTEDHEWLLIADGVATIGITDHAQNALGDVVFVEVPEVGAEFAQGDEAAVVESVKAASEVYAPITGTITQVNEDLETDPSLVNTAPLDGGYFFKITVADASELDTLMDEAAYNDFIAE